MPLSLMYTRLMSLLATLLLIHTTHLHAFTGHIEEENHIPSPVAKYRLIDLGEADFYPEEHLSKFTRGISYAPCINNEGVVIANNSSGGVLRSTSQNKWEFAPQINGMKIFFHALNDRGDLVVTLSRDIHALEWLVWLFQEGKYEARYNVRTVDPFYSRTKMLAINNSLMAVGFEKEGVLPSPIVWNPPLGPRRLGEECGLDVHGAAKAINPSGTVAGNYDTLTENSIFVWNARYGLEALKNYRNRLQAPGWVEFADLVLTDDDIVYGTYWVKHCTTNDNPPDAMRYEAYAWNPHKPEFQGLDLGGMRIASVNRYHVLVGSQNGRAVVREPCKKPVALDVWMPLNEIKDWQLLEATCINDNGQIVGIGKYRGVMHFYLAEPLD